MKLLPQGLIKLFAVSVGVGSNDSNITWLRSRIVDGGVLLDFYLQGIVVPISGRARVLSDVLAEDSMFPDMEGKSHFPLKCCRNPRDQV